MIKVLKCLVIAFTLLIAYFLNSDYINSTKNSALASWNTKALESKDVSLRVLRPGKSDLLLSTLSSTTGVKINNNQLTRLVGFLNEACHSSCHSSGAAQVAIEIFDQTEKERLEISDIMLRKDIRIQNFLTLASLIAAGDHIVKEEMIEKEEQADEK